MRHAPPRAKAHSWARAAFDPHSPFFLQGDFVMQSSWDCKNTLHVAIIMDGNGRWATARGLPRSRGHQAGVEAVRQVVAAAPELGVTALTLFAFSADNWHRPQAEVTALMALIDHYVRGELQQLVASGVRLTIIGRRNRLPDG